MLWCRGGLWGHASKRGSKKSRTSINKSSSPRSRSKQNSSSNRGLRVLFFTVLWVGIVGFRVGAGFGFGTLVACCHSIGDPSALLSPTLKPVAQLRASDKHGMRLWHLVKALPKPALGRSVTLHKSATSGFPRCCCITRCLQHCDDKNLHDFMPLSHWSQGHYGQLSRATPIVRSSLCELLRWG